MGIEIYIQSRCVRCGAEDMREVNDMDDLQNLLPPYRWAKASLVFYRDESVVVGRTGRVSLEVICPACADQIRAVLQPPPKEA